MNNSLYWDWAQVAEHLQKYKGKNAYLNLNYYLAGSELFNLDIINNSSELKIGKGKENDINHYLWESFYPY